MAEGVYTLFCSPKALTQLLEPIHFWILMPLSTTYIFQPLNPTGLIVFITHGFAEVTIIPVCSESMSPWSFPLSSLYSSNPSADPLLFPDSPPFFFLVSCFLAAS